MTTRYLGDLASLESQDGNTLVSAARAEGALLLVMAAEQAEMAAQGQSPGVDEAGMTYRAAVITASNRSAAGLRPDTSGPILVGGLRDLGIEVSDPIVVPDGEPVGQALRDAVASGIDLILTTGGTGLSPTDRTPEMTRLVIDREVPGLADAIRDHGTQQGIATAILSRGIAGLAGRVLIINAPGSPGGCRDAIAALSPVLLHALDQISGLDH
jgi:molybdenum cofactor synthesis domain-containing protein